MIGDIYCGSRIPDPGIKKALDPGSGSATLLRCNGQCALVNVEDPDPR
jgi:hypothetical protein